jgi:hypothetical protein
VKPQLHAGALPCDLDPNSTTRTSCTKPPTDLLYNLSVQWSILPNKLYNNYTYRAMAPSATRTSCTRSCQLVRVVEFGSSGVDILLSGTHAGRSLKDEFSNNVAHRHQVCTMPLHKRHHKMVENCNEREPSVDCFHFGRIFKRMPKVESQIKVL